MHAIMFIGLQAAGKSTFYGERYCDTHVRVNLDMLRTRHREERLIAACLEISQPFVIDNTNVSRKERERYFAFCASAGVPVNGYYFQSEIGPCLQRNAARDAERRVPEKGVLGTHSRLEVPALDEGFSSLHYVRQRDGGGFGVAEWKA